MQGNKKKRARRSFTDEFKREAVRLVLEEGKTVGQVARDLEKYIHPYRKAKKPKETEAILQSGIAKRRVQFRLFQIGTTPNSFSAGLPLRGFWPSLPEGSLE
ncbi:MAG: transposase [Deltaproteobacteria bacterium]|nr:transposase [Deltaproteobacteria bacterium]